MGFSESLVSGALGLASYNLEAVYETIEQKECKGILGGCFTYLWSWELVNKICEAGGWREAWEAWLKSPIHVACNGSALEERFIFCLNLESNFDAIKAL